MKSLHDNPEGGAAAIAVLDQLFEVTDVLGTMMQYGTAQRGLSTARASVLWALDHAGAMTQAALANALAVTPRNVTGLLDALQADGLAERRAHPADRRASLVRLTDDGAAVVAELRGGREELARQLFRDMPLTQRDALHAALRLVLERLHEVVDTLEH